MDASKTSHGSDVESPPIAGHGTPVLVEIVSALSLPRVDIMSASDPYVVVKNKEGKKIHRTKYMVNTENPIWSVETGSLFLLRVQKGEIENDNAKLTFSVKDHGVTKKLLGDVQVPLSKIVKSKQAERTEYALKIPESFSKKGEKAPQVRNDHEDRYSMNWVDFHLKSWLTITLL